MVVKAWTAVAAAAAGGALVAVAASAVRDTRTRAARSEVQAGFEAGLQELQAGRYHEAEGRLQPALALAERSFGKDDLDTGRVLNALGMIDKYTGRCDEGRIFYRRALVIAERANP